MLYYTIVAFNKGLIYMPRPVEIPIHIPNYDEIEGKIEVKAIGPLGTRADNRAPLKCETIQGGEIGYVKSEANGKAIVYWPYTKSRNRVSTHPINCLIPTGRLGPKVPENQRIKAPKTLQQLHEEAVKLRSSLAIPQDADLAPYLDRHGQTLANPANRPTQPTEEFPTSITETAQVARNPLDPTT